MNRTLGHLLCNEQQNHVDCTSINNLQNRVLHVKLLNYCTKPTPSSNPKSKSRHKLLK